MEQDIYVGENIQGKQDSESEMKQWAQNKDDSA
jgi:hypothetical protein